MPSKKGYRPLLIICIFLAACLVSIAQRPTIILEKMGENGALPDANFPFQDSEGVMWLATLDGLYSYDGTSYIPFRYNPLDSTSLSGNRINSLYEDSQKRLWVGTIGYGLNLSDSRKRLFKSVPLNSPDGKIHLNIYGTVEDKHGRIWLTTENGLIVLQENDNSEFEFVAFGDLSNSERPIAQDFRNALIMKDKSERIWFGTFKGLYRFDPDNHWLMPNDMKSLSPTFIHDIETDVRGDIWISTKGEYRLFRFDEDENQFHPLKDIPFVSKTSPIKFCFDADNRLWASEFGNALIGYDVEEQYTFLDSRKNSTAQYVRFWRSPFLDDSGNLWICGDGVYKYAYPKGFNSYMHSFQFVNSSSAIHHDGNTLWMAFREAGIVKYDLESDKTAMFSKSSTHDRKLHSNLIYSIQSIDQNVKVLGSLGAVELMVNDKIERVHRVSGVRYIHLDGAGRVWVAAMRGLFELDLAGDSLRYINMSAELGRGNYYFQSIADAGANNLWIATEGHGLIHYNVSNDVLTRFTPATENVFLPSWRINDLDTDDSGNLWIGTDVGLVLFDTKSQKSTIYNSNNNLKNDFISSIIIEDSSHIWVSTNSGISYLDTSTASFVNYGPKDGLHNVFYYPRAKARSENGIFYFGGRDGVEFFHPQDLRKNPYPPKLKLTAVQAPPMIIESPTQQQLSKGWSFPHQTEIINLKFAGLHYSSPENVFISYRIEGLKDEWKNIGRERSLALTGLRPGNYIVHLRAMSPDGVMSESEVAVPLHIRPPFWATVWFRILALGLILTGIIFAFKHREARIMSKEQQRAEFNKQMLDLEKNALLAQMNPHFIFNAMNSIQQYIYSNDNAGAMKYLSRFSRLLRNVLHVSSQSLIPLNDEIQLIRDYVELEKMRFPDKFDFDIKVDPNININSVEISPFLIQPQVENAILHGLLNKTKPGCLNIHLEHFDQHNIKVVVEDDGIGRKRAGELQLSQKFKHTGKATSIVRKRLMHNEYVNGSAPYSIIDLYNDKNEAIGTRVEMLIHTH